MTAIASDNLEPSDEWGVGDEIHFELYMRLTELSRLSEHNALTYFANTLMVDAADGKRQLDDEEILDLDAFMDMCIHVDHIVQKHLGKEYIADYIATLEDNDD